MSTLIATKREAKENLGKLRKEGGVPAVFYGSNQETTSITIKEIDFIRLYRKEGETGVFQLDVDGTKLDAMTYDYQLHPVSQKVLHVDFRIVDANKAIEVTVPVVFTGESPVERTNIGTVTHVTQELTIKALPNEIPHEIEVDVSGLDGLDSQITAAEINLAKGLELMEGLDTVIAVVAAIRADDDAETSGEVDMDAIEATKEKGVSEEEEDK